MPLPTLRIACALVILPALAASLHAAEVRGNSRVDSVTVYPSGAEVVRLGRVKLDGGDHVILFPELPALAVHNSIRVEGKATGKLEISSVDARRVFVTRGDAAAAATERKRIEDAIEKLKDERAAQQAGIDAAEAQKTLINNLAQLPARPQPQNGAAPPQPDWTALFALIGQRMAEAQKAILDTKVRMRETERQIADLEKKLASIAPAQDERTEVKVFVSAGTALEADITIRYQVRGAGWIPFYDARLSSGTRAEPPKLQLVRRASIHQRSGEVWENVAVALSTARPEGGTAAPVLYPVTIDYEAEGLPPPQRPVPLAGSPRSLSGGQRTASATDELEKSAERAEESRAKVEVQPFQAVYAIAGRVTIPATGESKRVQIDTMDLDPALTVRTVPKRELKAYVYAKLTTARGTPILPGQVSLFRDATFVGSTRLPFLSPGEEHELGFGVDDSIRVRHAVVEEKRGETGLITTSKTDVRSYRITVKNLHERAVQLTVLDQVPVSTNTDIKIEQLGKTAPSRRDVDGKRGVLAWDMKLEPDEEKAVEFGYRVTWPSAKKITYGTGS
jgi:uncharacterized protein (TIGR02231 family)